MDRPKDTVLDHRPFDKSDDTKGSTADNIYQNSNSDSIEELRQKQCHLQKQLDEKLELAKTLELKQKRKLQSLIDPSEEARGDSDNLSEESDEDGLIEFQQIENELRITELNRQLRNIQEEIRLRLYKRLSSNVADGITTSESCAIFSTRSEQSINSGSKISSNNEASCSNNTISPASNSNITVPVGNSPIYSSSLRNSSANSDLQRIDEDDEDNEEFYANADRFRTIYEEKISPFVRATELRNSLPKNMIDLGSERKHLKETNSDFPSDDKDKLKSDDSIDARPINNSQAQESFINSNQKKAINSNRPLTIYLPKPEENIDLVEHTQTLGHDLNLISSDLKISPTNAHGYLYKACSNNDKKWLKRYFFFDRLSKTLSYYHNEKQLVERGHRAKMVIPFDETKDVYVDHEMIGTCERKGKRRSFIFVLVTSKRRYLLATSRAEVMRAWVDVLFTASKPDDYYFG